MSEMHSNTDKRTKLHLCLLIFLNSFLNCTLVGSDFVSDNNKGPLTSVRAVKNNNRKVRGRKRAVIRLQITTNLFKLFTC